MSDFLGYTDPRYALSLQEFGKPRELPRSGGWILVRQIPGTPYKDAMGCYPLFACRDWTKLHEDMESAGEDLVSLTLVTDPFSGVTHNLLEQYFDFVKPFKTHYVVDLNAPLERSISKHHRYYARKALKLIDIEFSEQPAKFADAWTRLYYSLINKHAIKGISSFSRKSFDIQLNIPGMVMFLARKEGEIVGANLVLIGDHIAHSHLAAYTNEGYNINTSYGNYWQAIDYCKQQGIHYFNLGGAAGLQDDAKDGLAEFKRGWSNERRTVYLCGRIFDQQKYESICSKHQITNVDYFPAYRGLTI